MLSKLLYLIAVILFVALAAFHPDPTSHLLEWGLACIAAGLLLEGVGPTHTVLVRRGE